MPNSFYTKNNEYIRNPDSYAKTGAPMYKTKYGKPVNINKLTDIYELSLKHNKKYIGKTTDIDRRMKEHFSGNGAKVTQKFAPVKGKVIDQCPGYFSDKVEQMHTKANIEKYGYENVRGGSYTNSKTLKASKPLNTKSSHKQVTCFKCGKEGHYANNCNKTYTTTGSNLSKSYNNFCESEYDY